MCDVGKLGPTERSHTHTQHNLPWKTPKYEYSIIVWPGSSIFVFVSVHECGTAQQAAAAKATQRKRQPAHSMRTFAVVVCRGGCLALLYGFVDGSANDSPRCSRVFRNVDGMRVCVCVCAGFSCSCYTSL